MDYEAKLEEIAQKIRAIDYESGGNYTLGIIAILREAFPDEGRKNHPVLNPEVLVADIRAEGSPGKGRWKMSHKMAGDAVIAFTKNWAANVLASEAPSDSAKGEADEVGSLEWLYGACSEIEVALDCLTRRQGSRPAYADNALKKIREKSPAFLAVSRSSAEPKTVAEFLGPQLNAELERAEAVNRVDEAERRAEAVEAELAALKASGGKHE
jgi:hypothetical protein